MPAPTVTIPGTAVHTLTSERIDQTYEIWVARPVPAMLPGPEQKPAVLYVLDANLFFGLVTDMTRIMHQLYRELPPLLVVGIAYPTNDRNVLGQLRSRDFTPTSDLPFIKQGAAMMPNIKPILPEDERTGGGPAFLSFIRDQLKPFIAEHYDVATDKDTLFGSSLGGLFALYTLFCEPDTFAGYVIASPAIWWDDGMLFELEKQACETLDDLPAHVFLGVGATEEDPRIPMLARFKMVTHVRTMVDRLRAHDFPSLHVEGSVLPYETHTSSVPVVLTRGLRLAFR